jgi:hypothetical protein
MESLKLRNHLNARLAPLFELARADRTKLGVRLFAAPEREGDPLADGALAGAFAGEEFFDAPLARYGIDDVRPVFQKTLVRYVTGLVDQRSMRQAILERPELVARWNLLTADVDPDGANAVDLRRILAELAATETMHKLQPRLHWPADVSPKDIAVALEHTRDKVAAPLAKAMHEGAFFVGDDGLIRGKAELYTREAPPLQRPNGETVPGGLMVEEELERALLKWSIAACALVVSIEKAVSASLHRPMIALDAGRPHHELLTGRLRVSAKKEVCVSPLEEEEGRCELHLPGQQVIQLLLPLEGESLSEAFTNAIRQWRSFIGLRHWAALQRLLSIEGGRSGRVRWKLEDHLDALGLSKRWREDPERRQAVATEVDLLTKMELAVYAPNGELRLRAPILSPTAKIDAKIEGPDGQKRWSLEGMELQINPLLYEGVRDRVTGKLGKHWHPAPAELAKIDHVRFPHAIALGLVLPIRWRWVWAENGQDHLTLEAAKLLHLAGISWIRGRPGRAWDTLDRTLEELQRIGELGHVEWCGEKHLLATKVRLYPADWILDRTVRGLTPVERKPIIAPVNGAELVEWRKEKGWSQVALAKELAVGIATVKRAERAPNESLGRALVEAFKNYPQRKLESDAKT